MVLNLIMIYDLCTCISEMARAQGNLKLQENALTRWNYYLLATIAFMFSFVAILIPFLAVIFVLLLMVAFIVVIVMMMMLMKQAGEELTMRDLE